MRRAALLAGVGVVVVCLVGSCSRRGAAGGTGGAVRAVRTPGGVEMVALPGGSFRMGSDSGKETDEPGHRVQVGAFLIDRFEVTQASFQKVLARNPSRWKDPQGPVEQIRFRDAVEYCNARSRAEGLRPCYDLATWSCDFAADGYRLPTEAEWEYACRAGAAREYCFGDSPGGLGPYAWFTDNCTRSPQRVGTRQPNAWGLYDMHGNVWEWCNDLYDEAYYPRSPPTDPRGPEAGKTRVLRGGCWNSRADKCRSAYRNEEDPGWTDTCFGRDIHGLVGFRCVRRAGEGS